MYVSLHTIATLSLIKWHKMEILQIFTLLGALGMFLYGMNMMSSGLQKTAGDKLEGTEKVPL